MSGKRCTVPLRRRQNRPSYCCAVRIGLASIARKTRADSAMEVAALQWIEQMAWWHANVFSKKHRLGRYAQTTEMPR